MADNFAQAQSSPPDPPTGLTATSSSATQNSLSWNAPVSNVTGYKVTFQMDNGTFQDLVSNTASNATTFVHRNLMQGHVYSYQVFALNSNGQSAGSNIATIHGNQVPDAPSSLTLTPTLSGILLSWNAPQNNSDITGYKIEYSTIPNQWIVLNANTNNLQTSYQTGFSSDTNYNYRVSAINSAGEGKSIDSITSTQPGTTPTLTATAISPTQVELSWNAPSYTYGQQIIGYKIELKTGTNYATEVDNTGLVSSHTIDGLVSGKTYTYHVMALFAGDTQSPPSADVPVTPLVTSSTPLSSNLPYGSLIFLGRSYSGTENTATFLIPGPQIHFFPNPSLPINGIWANVSTFVKGAILYFDANGITYSINVNPDSNTWISFPFPLNISNVRMSILDHQTPVDLASVGFIAPKEESVPDAPQNLTANLNSTNTVQLSWNATQNANPPILGYQIEYKTTGDWFVLAQVPVPTYVQSGLALNNTYTYRVFAINNMGSSLPSNEVTISTPSSTYFPGIISQVLDGIIPIGNTTNSLSYSVSGGQVYGASLDKDARTLDFQLQGNTAGQLYLQLPRTLIDSKSPDGNDKPFSITIDNKTAVFTETKTDTYRTLTISYPSGKINVDIIGTSVLGGTTVMAGTIPEFPTALLGLSIGLISSILVSRKFFQH